MITMTPAPMTTIKRADQTLFTQAICPLCKDKVAFDQPPPELPVAAVTHTCADKTLVFFMNGYAMTGIEEYNSSERAGRRSSRPL